VVEPIAGRVRRSEEPAATAGRGASGAPSPLPPFTFALTVPALLLALWALLAATGLDDIPEAAGEEGFADFPFAFPPPNIRAKNPKKPFFFGLTAAPSGEAGTEFSGFAAPVSRSALALRTTRPAFRVGRAISPLFPLVAPWVARAAWDAGAAGDVKAAEDAPLRSLGACAWAKAGVASKARARGRIFINGERIAEVSHGSKSGRRAECQPD